MGCGMACSCRTPRGVPRTKAVTPGQLAARRNGFGGAPAGFGGAPAGIGLAASAPPTAQAVAAMSMTEAVAPFAGSQAGMSTERRLAEKKRRDTLRNKLGR